MHIERLIVAGKRVGQYLVRQIKCAKMFPWSHYDGNLSIDLKSAEHRYPGAKNNSIMVKFYGNMHAIRYFIVKYSVGSKNDGFFKG